MGVASVSPQTSSRHGVTAPDHPAEQPFSSRRRSSTAPSGRVSQNTTPAAAAAPAFRPAPANPRQTAGARAHVPPRAWHAARFARGADCRAEIHHRLGEITGTLGRHQLRAPARRSRLCRRHRLANREKPRHPPRHCHRPRPCAGRTQSPMPRRYFADTRQRPQPGDIIGKASAMPLGHHPGAGMQIAGAGVVASLPLMQHSSSDEAASDKHRASAP